MFYQNMPLYLKLISLLKKEYLIVHEMPKEYKFSLGQDLLGKTWKMIDIFINIQISPPADKNNKIKLIKKINLHFEELKLRFRFLLELKLISLGQAAKINETLVEIGKMIGSWLKNA